MTEFTTSPSERSGNTSSISVKAQLYDGLWKNNPALVQLLGLCPLLAVSNSAINGLALGLATAFTVFLSNFVVSACRHMILPEIRIPVFVIIISGIVTLVGILMNAFAHELFLRLGLFIPLIITNCAILARAESFAVKNPVFASSIDGLTTGAGFAWVLVLLGALREFIGSGTVMADANLLFSRATVPLVDISQSYGGLLVAILPPGAFILFGLLLALKNLLSNSNQKTT